MECKKCASLMIMYSVKGLDKNYRCPNCETIETVKDCTIHKNAIKYDKGKLRYDLIPTDSLKELAKVFTYGAEVHGDRNWEKGMEWGRIYGAIQRHLNAFWSGEEINEEDADLSHLAQAAWNCLILESYRLRKIGKDTREKNATNNSE